MIKSTVLFRFQEFNLSPIIVRQWQNNLDAMKDDGAFAAIWNKWYEGTEMP
ncbi:MAG: hypothetical protein PF436_01190 [Prolixibacteraceae bacterium]|nr:hypothetical protein [Prolixibacteraceae bacterium]